MSTAAPKPSLKPAFRRFTNAVLKVADQRGSKWFHYTADKRAGLIVVTVNEKTAPEKAAELERLVKRWRGVVMEHDSLEQGA